MDYKYAQDNSIRSEIYQMLERVGLSDYYSEILRIGIVALDDRDSALRDLTLIDKTIPGLGRHNFNEKTGTGSGTAVARIEDRAIFRPIQYVGIYLRRRRAVGGVERPGR